MSDVRILPAYNELDYSISLGSTETKCNGNVALVNRFQIIFFDEGFNFIGSDGEDIVEDFGGRASSIIGSGRSLVSEDGIRASISVAIKNTVDSMKAETTSGMPDTEILDSAVLASVNIVGDVVMATIDIYPVEIEGLTVPQFQIPIIGR